MKDLYEFASAKMVESEAGIARLEFVFDVARFRILFSRGEGPGALSPKRRHSVQARELQEEIYALVWTAETHNA